MKSVSRRSSRQPVVQGDEVNSLTSFPDPGPESPQEEEAAKKPLHDLLDRHGPSMFDENTRLEPSDPQTLSAASPDVLRDVIDHHGAVELVRRLATMLAERDAQIAALMRLVEEYHVPKERVVEGTSRVRQAEIRRLSLATASEDLAPSSGIASDSSDSNVAVKAQQVQGVVNGFTKLFGGAGKRRDEPTQTATSSRSTSQPPKAPERPRSVDVASIKSNESNTWTSALFSMSALNRTESRTSNREPVEMSTRYDKAQLPPTLSNQTKDPQEAEWNRFIIRLAKLRRRVGDDVSSGELIGVSRLHEEVVSGHTKLEILTRLVIGGIPTNLRHAVWMELSNTHAIIQPNEYAYYLSVGQGRDELEIDAILKDVQRTHTSRYDFYSAKGSQRLKEVLVAFIGKHEDLGYTQGLNMIAGSLLLAIPSSEDAFWVLCNIVENFFPRNYFARSDAMVPSLADNALLRDFVSELMPSLFEHMQDLKIDADHTAPIRWLFTAFSSVLPELILWRIWDVWLCLPEQKHFLFSFALSLLAHNAEGIKKCKDIAEYLSYMDGGIKLPQEGAQLDDLIKQAYRIGKRLDNVEARRKEEVEKVKERMSLDQKLQLRRSGSLEVLVDRQERIADVAQEQDA